MEVKNNQNIFDITLEKFGTLENLFSDVLNPNSLSIDANLKTDQLITVDATGKGNKVIKNAIKEQGLIMSNGEIENNKEWILTFGIWNDNGIWIDTEKWID